ncbi:conserved hypothetical protein [Candidatus Terasakiella magnetica]|uniref:DUF2336 domain-containing protein n=1 Tax=Candidatus Terasakiella magnetica TaxID=1867952 RepID=A0A1C3RID6_9PROT|nr:DUF2336 domain-containing protein [Candidatus Terasakiella magnetica]SCA57022.1 conserved hypothetical protein [Candidatus Terasakiella magnetica]
MVKDPAHDAPLTYEEAKEMARHHDVAVRKTLAEREDIRPEILFYLAGDAAPEVRKAIALNKNTPSHAYVELAKDSNDEIRSDLAKKITDLAPKLTAYEVDRVQSYAYQALEILASDQLANIRVILAETLKDVAQAPEEVIKTLAHDSELSVACPVLEHSPVLRDEDLLDIISSGISSGALGAISNRSTVSSDVSDAIVETHDVPAITTLLCNDSAQIREETLDHLIEESQDITEWQGPLVQRPVLSTHAVRRLAEFVADNLMDALQEREDMSAEVLGAVRDEVNRRIAQTHKEPSVVEKTLEVRNNNDLRKEYAWLFQQPPHVIAQNLKRMDRLDQQVIINAMAEGENEFVVAALAEKASLHLSVAQRMITMRSARGVSALCWKAGMEARVAAHIQAKVAHIPAEDILKHNKGGYALNEEELQWQVDFFNNMSV